MKTQDVGTLLAPFIDSCGGDMRELDRARCRSTTTYLRKKLPQQTFIAESNDPAAIEVSGYDGAAKGYHLSLAGCIACSEPMPIGSHHEPRFVTLATPDKSAASLAAGVPVSKSTVAFDDFAAAKHWAEMEKPFLRAEFLFQPQAEGSDFTVGMAPGIALKLVGARVYNRCTGEILVSKPPSTGFADRPPPGHEDPACSRAGQPQPMTDEELAADRRPEELSKAAINDVMEKIRPQVLRLLPEVPHPRRAGAELRRGRQRNRAVGPGRVDLRRDADRQLRDGGGEGDALPRLQARAARLQVSVLSSSLVAAVGRARLSAAAGPPPLQARRATSDSRQRNPNRSPTVR